MRDNGWKRLPWSKYCSSSLSSSSSGGFSKPQYPFTRHCTRLNSVQRLSHKSCKLPNMYYTSTSFVAQPQTVLFTRLSMWLNGTIDLQKGWLWWPQHCMGHRVFGWRGECVWWILWIYLANENFVWYQVFVVSSDDGHTCLRRIRFGIMYLWTLGGDHALHKSRMDRMRAYAHLGLLAILV